jgi:hypothetical protein
MGFIGTYKEADTLLNQMENGTCAGRCRQVWRQHIRLALTKKTNPLKLTKAQKKALSQKLEKLKGKRVDMVRKQTRKQRGGQGMGQPLKYMNASYQEPSASTGSNLQGIMPPTLAREGLNVKPMVGGQILSPMTFQDAYHSKPLAPTGQSLTDLVMPPTLRQGLNLGKMAGGRRRSRKACGGFYPSIMGGVLSNAPLLAPLAARQGLELFSQYKTSTRRRRNRKQTRKTARRRSSGRR